MKKCIRPYSLALVVLGACSSSSSLYGVGSSAAGAAAPSVAASQVGSEADGAFHANAQGHFIADADARRAFEYAFSATGESDEAALQSQAAAMIDAQLQSGARGEAHAVLHAYEAYRAAAQVTSAPTSLSDRLAAVAALRAKYFDEVTRKGLFGEDEQRAQITLAEQKVRADAALSARDKGAQLGALDAQLPAGDVAVRGAALLPVQAQRAEAALRAAGDSTDAVHTQRVQSFGEAGALRLANLDASRANFAATMGSLRALRQALTAQGSAARDVSDALEQAISAGVPMLEQAHARALLAQ